MTETSKISMKNLTASLFPGSPEKTISIQQLNDIFDKQLFGKQQKQQLLETTPRVSSSIPKQQQQQIVSTKKPKISTRQKQIETRAQELRKMNLEKLKDLCLSEYRIDCGKLRKKEEVVSVLIQKEFPAKRKRRVLSKN